MPKVYVPCINQRLELPKNKCIFPSKYHWSPSNRPWWWPNRHKKTRKRAIVWMCKPMNFNWTLLVWRPSYPNPKDKREHCKMGKMDEWSKFRFQYSHNRFFFLFFSDFPIVTGSWCQRARQILRRFLRYRKVQKSNFYLSPVLLYEPLSCRVRHIGIRENGSIICISIQNRLSGWW